MDTTLQTFTPVDVAARKQVGIKPGDTVRVHQKIEEKGKTRIQVFEGVVLAVKHGTEPGATFTVRRTASGVGVERIFPLYSPVLEKIEIVRRAKVRRAKLYYIREKVAREIKRQMRRMQLTSISTDDFKQPEPEEVPAEEVAAAETPEESHAPAGEVTDAGAEKKE